MKINNVNVSRQEAENLIPAIKYEMRNNGALEVETQTCYLAGCRTVHAIVHVAHGWDKEFNLTSGEITNIATTDDDGDHDIILRIEKLMDRMRGINSGIAELEKIVDHMKEINSHFAEQYKDLWS